MLLAGNSHNKEMKYSTALSGNRDLDSPYNCAANVLLCDNISVGFCTF